MADLTPLLPNGDGTTTAVETTGTNRWDQINSDPDTDPSTSTYIYQTDATATSEIWLALTGVDGDFGNMTTAQLRVYVQTSGTRANDDVTLSAGVADGDNSTTYLAGASSTTRETVAVWNAGNDPPTEQVYAINATYVNTGSNKAAWDGAYLHLHWAYSKSAGWDNIKIQVAAVEIVGTYAPGDVVVTPAAASAVAAVVAPTVVLGSVTVTPAAASATATVVDPTVVIPPVGGAASAAMYLIAPRLCKPPPGWRADPMAALNRGLVGWWMFNEGAGTLAQDVSGNGSHGTMSSAMHPPSDWVGSLHGRGLDFNSTSDTMECGSNPLLDIVGAGRTIAAWVATTDTQTFNQLARKYDGSNGWQFGVSSGNVAYYPGTGVWRTSTSTMNDGAWHHIALVDVTGVECRFYIDGIPDGTGTAGNPQANTGIFCIMGPPVADLPSSNCLDGTIDDLRVWNRALSAEEVAELYARPYG